MEEKYLSLHLSQIHNIKNIRKEYEHYLKFFSGNFKKELPRNRKIKILDMGCGLGETLFSLRKLGYYNVIGIDYSQECVDFCNKMGYAKCYMGNALDYFDTCSEKYDVIFFNDIIEHFQYQDAMHILQGMMQCLNRGG
ncbi:MAG: class I SAM-dependent methyltransferase [Eubacterium sp.]|nr:class I SAM-dependent methyltransferase [Eubacterium sp.]